MDIKPFEDQLNTVMERMVKVDPASEEFEILARRRDELRRIIRDEEERANKEASEHEMSIRELMIKEAELKNHEKDRLLKWVLGGATIALGFASTYADKFTVVVDKGVNMANNVKKLFF